MKKSKVITDLTCIVIKGTQFFSRDLKRILFFLNSLPLRLVYIDSLKHEKSDERILANVEQPLPVLPVRPIKMKSSFLR